MVKIVKSQLQLNIPTFHTESQFVQNSDSLCQGSGVLRVMMMLTPNLSETQIPYVW